MKEGKKEKEKTIPSQDTMLSILNYYKRNANQNNKKSNLPVRMTTLTSLQTVKGGEIVSSDPHPDFLKSIYFRDPSTSVQKAPPHSFFTAVVTYCVDGA